MGRAPCCSKVGMDRGSWTAKEDILLINYIQSHGHGNWRSLPKNAGLKRCGKSCRLRWMNYLRPDIKRGDITPDEEDLIIRMHALLGNRWSLIAGRLPGRTDNEIKNYWNTSISKKLRSQGIDPYTHKKMADSDQYEIANPKRIHNSSSSKNKSKLEPEKQKIHNPKAVRFTSLTSLPISNNKINPSSEGQRGESATGTLFEDSSDYDKINFLVGDEFFNVSDLDFQFIDPISAAHLNNLDELFDEYAELLNT